MMDQQHSVKVEKNTTDFSLRFKSTSFRYTPVFWVIVGVVTDRAIPVLVKLIIGFFGV